MGIYQETKLSDIAAATAELGICRKGDSKPTVIQRFYNPAFIGTPTIRKIRPNVSFAVGLCIRIILIRHRKTYKRHIANNLQIKANRFAAQIHAVSRNSSQIQIVVSPNTAIARRDSTFHRFFGIGAYRVRIQCHRTAVYSDQTASRALIIRFGVGGRFVTLQFAEIEVVNIERAFVCVRRIYGSGWQRYVCNAEWRKLCLDEFE